MRVYNQILGPHSGQVQLADRLEEATERQGRNMLHKGRQTLS
jgi:hypothetical protein